MTTHPKRVCVVRLTEDAVADLHRLGKKGPHAVRTVFKKLLLLERSPNAGEPLLGALIGFRKLVVGDRHWRIVWRVTEDTDGTPIFDISEVWAVGIRSDSEIYEELKARVTRIGHDPKLQPLKDVITQMGRLYESVGAAAEHTGVFSAGLASGCPPRTTQPFPGRDLQIIRATRTKAADGLLIQPPEILNHRAKVTAASVGVGVQRVFCIPEVQATLRSMPEAQTREKN